MHKPEINWMDRVVVVCVDSYLDGVLAGRFYHPHSEDGIAFRSLSQFLTEMDQALDLIAFPQSFNAVRTFGETLKRPAPSRPKMQIMEGELATFSIRVLFRQNASWQGAVRWIEGEREESFRSALELVFLLDSVLSHDTDKTQVC